jgi:hypothetical protein
MLNLFQHPTEQGDNLGYRAGLACEMLKQFGITLILLAFLYPIIKSTVNIVLNCGFPEKFTRET